MKIRGLVAAALMALASTAATAAPSTDGKNRWITVYNNTGYAIMAFYGSNSWRSSWEEDILGRAIIRPHSSHRINMNDGTGACSFDLKAVMSDGNEIVRTNVNVCRVESWTITE